MPSLQRPGVYVQESLSPSFVATPPGNSIAAFVGPMGRGPTAPTLVQSWTDFVTKYGGFENPIANNYLPFSVYNFFNNGGRAAVIVRTLGTGSALGTVTLQDREGTPVATLRVDAVNPGSWGNGIYIEITDGSGTDLFNITVYSGGGTSASIVERWADLSMDPNSPNYAPSRIGSAVNGSAWIVVTDLAPTATTAYAQRRPALQTPTALTGGLNGAAPSGTNVSNAINSLDQIDIPLVLNLPGDTTNVAAAITYAEGRGDVFVIVDPVAGVDPATVVSFATGLTASSYAAVYYPWVTTSDPSSTSPGATRTVPPGGFIAGKYAETDAARGVFKAPAGLQTRLSSAVAVERKLTNSDLDTLNSSKVNAIRQIPGAGIVVMGSRTLSSVLNTRYVPVRRTLIEIERSLADLTRFAIFEPNDYLLRQMVASVVDQYLMSLWHSGGLNGSSASEAYYVKCDSDNNTPTSVAAGELNVEVGVALQRPAEFVVIKIGQWEGGRRTVEIAA